MALGFGGEVVGFYQRYRRGYPVRVIDELVTAFGLTGGDTVVDLGCGTGQLTLPLADRVRAVVGVDPEPDMLAAARRVAAEQGRTNVSWLLGADADVPALVSLLGERSVAAVTIGQALHWMDHDRLFPSLLPLFRAAGGVAVLTNGQPLWQQDADFSRALGEVLGDLLGSPLSRTCGTDGESQLRYRQSLVAAGYAVSDAEVHYTDELTLEQIIGGIYSAFHANQLPKQAERAAFADRIGTVLQSHAPYIEDITVRLLIGCAPSSELKSYGSGSASAMRSC